MKSQKNFLDKDIKKIVLDNSRIVELLLSIFNDEISARKNLKNLGISRGSYYHWVNKERQPSPHLGIYILCLTQVDIHSILAAIANVGTTCFSVLAESVYQKYNFKSHNRFLKFFGFDENEYYKWIAGTECPSRTAEILFLLASNNDIECIDQSSEIQNWLSAAFDPLVFLDDDLNKVYLKIEEMADEIDPLLYELHPLTFHWKKLSRNQLTKLIWSAPLTLLAEIFKKSDNGVRKWAKEENIPLPIRGFWAKVKSGKVPYPAGTICLKYSE